MIAAFRPETRFLISWVDDISGISNQAALGTPEGPEEGAEEKPNPASAAGALVRSVPGSLPPFHTWTFSCRHLEKGSLISQRDTTTLCYREIASTYRVFERSPVTAGTWEQCYLPRTHGRMFREIKHTDKRCRSLKCGGGAGPREP